MEVLRSPYSSYISCLTLQLNVCIINHHAADEAGTFHDFVPTGSWCAFTPTSQHLLLMERFGSSCQSLLHVPLGATPGTRDWQGQGPIWDNIEWDPSSVQKFSVQLSQLLVVDAARDCVSYRCLRLHAGVLPFPAPPFSTYFFEEYFLINYFYTDLTSGSVLRELNWRHNTYHNFLPC